MQLNQMRYFSVINIEGQSDATNYGRQQSQSIELKDIQYQKSYKEQYLNYLQGGRAQYKSILVNQN